MSAKAMPRLTYRGCVMETSVARFGLLASSASLAGDGAALRARMAADGYVYMPGLLNRDDVVAARRAVLQALAGEGALDADAPLMDGIARGGITMSFRPDLIQDSAPIRQAVYDGPMMTFAECLIGEPVRHFDFTWLRAKSPGPDTATHPHCDVVYMGRGTRTRLFTAWTPLSDVPWELGGLMILEGSHRRADHLADYWQMDVDTYCENGSEAESIRSGARNWETAKQGGAYDYDAPGLAQRMDARWLSAEFSVGDVLFFTMHTLHASLDNQTDRFRLSTDTRYQPRSEPVDPRWVGAVPPGHGLQSKVQMIC